MQLGKEKKLARRNEAEQMIKGLILLQESSSSTYDLQLKRPLA
jgi:hypothetical protein